MGKKQFMTYDEQIAFLLSKDLIIDNIDDAKRLLENYSYFTLVNGYKDPFKGKDKKYKKNTRFEDIYYLYEFDDELRHIFIKYLFLVEMHLKSLISYYFCYKFGEEESEYQNVTNYDYQNVNNQKSINKLVEILSENLENADSWMYVKHYVDRDDNVPLWVLIKTLTFGNISKMYTYQKPEIQSKICHNFPEIREDQMSVVLDILTRYRNVCAHNERLYDFKYKRKHLKTTRYHKEFGITTNKNTANLFEVVISLKLLLKKDDFDCLINEIKNDLDLLSIRTNQIQRKQILQLMGFPENWEMIKDI